MFLREQASEMMMFTSMTEFSTGTTISAQRVSKIDAFVMGSISCSIIEVSE